MRKRGLGLLTFSPLTLAAEAGVQTQLVLSPLAGWEGSPEAEGLAFVFRSRNKSRKRRRGETLGA